MGKHDKVMRYRTDGMEYALKIAKERGINALEKEVRYRNKTGVSLPVPIEEVNAATAKIKQTTLDAMIILTVAVLHDEFDFGAKECQRFSDRMKKKAEGLADDMVTWEEYIGAIKDELGFDLKIHT